MNEKYLGIVEIPSLGIANYTIDIDMGYGRNNKGDEFQGVLVDGKHYIINMEDVYNGTSTEAGDLIPSSAYVLEQIKSSEEAVVKKISDPSILEMIAKKVIEESK